MEWILQDEAVSSCETSVHKTDKRIYVTAVVRKNVDNGIRERTLDITLDIIAFYVNQTNEQVERFGYII